MGTSTENGYLSVAAATAILNKEVYAANEKAGYTRADGRKDAGRIRKRIFDTTADRGIVERKSDRAKIAVKRDPDLTSAVYPDVAPPDAFDDQPNPDLAREVWKSLHSDVWALASMGYDAGMQDLVAKEMGNGVVFCRTKIGSLDAVYLTADPVCINLDFLRIDNEETERRIDRTTGNREMLVIRQPQNAKLYMRDYEKRLGGALEQGMNRLQLAFDVASAGTNGTQGQGPTPPEATAATEGDEE